MDKIKYAKRLLTHYINIAAKTSDGIIGFDCQSEIEEIAEVIVEAAVEAASAAFLEEMAYLKERVERNETSIETLFQREG